MSFTKEEILEIKTKNNEEKSTIVEAMNKFSSYANSKWDEFTKAKNDSKFEDTRKIKKHLLWRYLQAVECKYNEKQITEDSQDIVKNLRDTMIEHFDFSKEEIYYYQAMYNPKNIDLSGLKEDVERKLLPISYLKEQKDRIKNERYNSNDESLTFIDFCDKKYKDSIKNAGWVKSSEGAVGANITKEDTKKALDIHKDNILGIYANVKEKHDKRGFFNILLNLPTYFKERKLLNNIKADFEEIYKIDVDTINQKMELVNDDGYIPENEISLGKEQTKVQSTELENKLQNENKSVKQELSKEQELENKKKKSFIKEEF